MKSLPPTKWKKDKIKARKEGRVRKKGKGYILVYLKGVLPKFTFREKMLL